LNEQVYGISIAGQVTVPVVRLPDIIDLSTLPRPILLKIDVQGAELEVLKGAEALLPLIDAIYCEVSFARLYEGQPLAEDIVQYLARNSFTLRGVFNQSSTKDLGPTQADFLFMLRVAN
jgi:hypothetical protein